MNSLSSTPSSSIFLVSVLLLSIFFPRYVYSDEEMFGSCASSTCGKITVDYPFWGNHRPDHCGLDGFKVDCNDGSILTLDINNLMYNIMDIRLDPPILTMTRADFSHSICPEPGRFFNTSFKNTPFYHTVGNENATFLYDCDTTDSPLFLNFTCLFGNINQNGYFILNRTLQQHLDEVRYNTSVVIPVLKTTMSDSLWYSISVQEIVNRGFQVSWNMEVEQCSECRSSGGRCGYNRTLSSFTCFCPGDATTCSSTTKPGVWKVRLKIIVGATSGGIVVVLAWIIIFYITRRRQSNASTGLAMNKGLSNQDIEALMRNYGTFTPIRYSFADVKKITSSFKEKLGQGGFASVYKGKLLDGRLVAVKMLNETKGNGEEFINEVASISRTSHINIVSLLGFCLKRHKRALIYEFMPNGSLEKFLGDESNLNTKQRLEWEQLYQIAIGVARGLEYLHRGCNTRIVHFDIKPQNILLDKDFFPKISDFGLAKLCTREKSILSMLEARGTIGYIAPEVFSRNFGGVSHKSDVYSYGTVLLEMVGQKRKDDNVASDASEKYFPYCVYELVELNKLEDLGVTIVEDTEIVRKIALVGLWCIQTNPSDRPSMSKVIEMLEGNIELLEVPPKPFLFSSDSCTFPLSLFSMACSRNSS